MLRRSLWQQPDAAVVTLWFRLRGCWVNRLCDDLLCTILSFLDARSSIWNSIRLVCKRWRCIAQLPRSHGLTLDIARHHKNIDPVTCRWVKYVEIGTNDTFQVLDRYPNACELFLYERGCVPPPGIGQRIRRLSLYSSHKPDSWLPHLPCLESLTVRIEDATPICNVSHPGLRRIRLIDCDKRLPKQFPHVPFVGCTHVRIQNVPFTDSSRPTVTLLRDHLPKLTSLCILGDIKVLETDGLQRIAMVVSSVGFPSPLQCPPNVTRLIYGLRTHEMNLGRLTNLVSLAITWHLIDKAMACPFVIWPLLKSLVVTGVGNDANVVYDTLTKRFPDLEEFRMAADKKDHDTHHIPLYLHRPLKKAKALMFWKFHIVNVGAMPRLFPLLRLLYASPLTHSRLPMTFAWCPAHASLVRSREGDAMPHVEYMASRESWIEC